MNHPTTLSVAMAAGRDTSHPRPRAARKRPAAAASDGEDRDDMIRRTAYAFYEARGCIDGHALDDWLQAKAQIEQASGSAPSAV